MAHIEHCTTLLDEWQKRKLILVELSTANQMRLYEKRWSMCLGDKNGAQSHMHHVATACTRLRAFYVEIDDMLYKLVLKRSLSTSFEYLPVALETTIDSIFVA